MTFSNLESSRQKGSPVNLYYFKYGSASSEYYAFCDSTVPVIYNSVTYNPVKIERPSFRASGSTDRTTMDIAMDFSNPLITLFKDYPPSSVIALTIYQGHIGDTEFPVAWMGSVASWKRSGNDGILSCTPGSVSLNRTCLRRHYQMGCPHVLFGPKCNANKSNVSIVKQVSSLLGNAFNLAPGWVVDAQVPYYIGGTVEWVNPAGSTERRTILDITSNVQLLLSGKTTGLAVAQNVTLIKRCNHTMDDCLNVHNNINNFGGQPWIPLKTPVGLKNSYY